MNNRQFLHIYSRYGCLRTNIFKKHYLKGCPHSSIITNAMLVRALDVIQSIFVLNRNECNQCAPALDKIEPERRIQGQKNNRKIVHDESTSLYSYSSLVVVYLNRSQRAPWPVQFLNCSRTIWPSSAASLSVL